MYDEELDVRRPTEMPRCGDSRKCFAKVKDFRGKDHCRILKEGYRADNCPFCKEHRNKKGKKK